MRRLIFLDHGHMKKSGVDSKISTFENIWNNKAKNIVTLDFPEVGYERLQSYKTEEKGSQGQEPRPTY